MPNATSPFATQLTKRGLIAITGDDRVNFLQGLISNDVAQAVEGMAIYAAFLTPQGKFLHDFFVIKLGEILLLDINKTRLPDLLLRLTAHKLRSKIALADASADYTIWAIWGGVPTDKNYAYTDARHQIAGYRLYLPNGAAPSGVEPTTYDMYDEHRIRLGLPDGERDLEVGKSTLLEGNFDRINGISWNKGCYMGQELTARTHYRGLIKKRLYTVCFQSTAPEFGAFITLNGQEVGVMRSSTNQVGLALLDVGTVESGQHELTAGNTNIHVVKGDE